MVGAIATHVETNHVFQIAGEPVLRDPRRSEFVVETVVVRHHSKRGVWWISATGRKVKNGHVTQGGYSVEDGLIQPDYRTGPAPQWLSDVLALVGGVL